MTDDLAAWLLEQLAEDEVVQQDHCRDPHEGLSDDELHDRRAHPAYEYATTQGQRKAWDYSHVPPWDDELGRPGDGWERNVTVSDPEAWERFEHHEESYWRRLRPEGPREHKPPAEAVFRLADIDAKRRIIEDSASYSRDDLDQVTDGLSARTLMLLALPYAGRPGYHEEWRP